MFHLTKTRQPLSIADRRRRPASDLEESRSLAVLRTLERDGIQVVLTHLQRQSRRWAKGTDIRLLDWGGPDADLSCAVAKWGRSTPFRLRLTHVVDDLSSLEKVRRQTANFPEISILEGHFREWPRLHELFDYAIASSCIHFWNDDTILEWLRQNDRFVVRGVILEGWRRSFQTWLGLRFTVKNLFANRDLIRTQAAFLRAGFREDELSLLATKAALPYAKVIRYNQHLVLASEKL